MHLAESREEIELLRPARDRFANCSSDCNRGIPEPMPAILAYSIISSNWPERRGRW